MAVTIFSDEDLRNGAYQIPVNQPKTLNNVLRITSTSYIYDIISIYTYLDLHTTRNLYLTSSTLASYDIISNFGNDTIIKKIPVKANYNDMLFDSGSEGWDSLKVSNRSLRNIDFKSLIVISIL